LKRRLSGFVSTQFRQIGDVRVMTAYRPRATVPDYVAQFASSPESDIRSGIMHRLSCLSAGQGEFVRKSRLVPNRAKMPLARHLVRGGSEKDEIKPLIAVISTRHDFVSPMLYRVHDVEMIRFS
jgi:hypothetical protein